MKVNMKQISEKTGFSQATISNALSGKRGVNAETAALIMKAAQELGYFAEEEITKVKFVTFYNCGAIENAPYFTPLISAVQKECRERGLELSLHVIDKRSLDFAQEVEKLQTDTGTGIIFLGTEMTDEDTGILSGIHSPLVVIDYWNADVPFNSVLIDNADSARMAAKYLLRRGHERIGYIRSKDRFVPFRDRERGLRQALEDVGLDLAKENILEISLQSSAYDADIKGYLDVQKENLPTAMFADDDTLALAVMKVMADYGIRIPEDVSIIGFDDIIVSAFASPALTTISVPKTEIGRAAVERLSYLMKTNCEIKNKIQVGTTLVERDSVRDLNVKE